MQGNFACKRIKEKIILELLKTRVQTVVFHHYTGERKREGQIVEPDAQDLDVLQHTWKLHGLVFSFHGCWIQAIASIGELHYEALRVPHCQVILGAQIL